MSTMSTTDNKTESALKFLKPQETCGVVNDERIEMHELDNASLDVIKDPRPIGVIEKFKEQPQQELYYNTIPTTTRTLNDKSENILIQGCQRKEDIFNSLASIKFVNEPNTSEIIFILKIEINADFVELNSDEQKRLSEIFPNRDVVAVLNGRDSSSSFIYWKSKEFDRLLASNPFIEKSSEDSKKLLEFVANFLTESLESGHLGILSTYATNPDLNQIDINILADTRNYNLLLIAAERGNAEIVRILLQLGMISDLLHIDAQTLAWEKRHFDVLLQLLNANLPYPKSFDVKKCSPELKEFYKNSVGLHKAIKEKNKENVRTIMHQNSCLKHYYTSSNDSALKTAINSKAPEIYDMLLENKLRFAPHEDAEELYKDLEYEMKRTLREIHNKYSQVSDEKHLNILFANSFISHDNENAQKNVEHIQRAFQILNANVFIKIILMIVAASRKFKIIFDFNRDSVNVADPTVESNTQGLFYLSGRIYIGAKQLLNEATSHETLGVMAHELCHYAMNVVFGNDARPYTSNDNQTMQEFEKISEDCQKNYEKEEIVDLVYDCYPEEAHHAELIVRVVHMLGFYYNQPEKLLQLQGYFTGLFSFYENKVVPEMKAALPGIEKKVEEEIRKKDKKISKLKRISILLGFLSVLGILAAIAVGFILHEPNYVFSELSPANKEKVENGLVKYKNIEVRFKDLFSKNSRAYEQITSGHIANLLKGKTLDFSDLHLVYLEKIIEHKWENLTDKLRQKVLNSNFYFQDEELKFEELHKIYPDILKGLSSKQITEILDEKKLVVSSIAKSDVDFYFERNFFYEDIYAIYYAYMKGIIRDLQTTDGVNIIETVKIVEKFEDIYENFMKKPLNDYLQEIYEIKYDNGFVKLSDAEFKVFDNDTVITYKMYQKNSRQIFEIIEEEKIFILSSEAGLGKTVTLKHFAVEFKKKFPLKWVSYIDLKDHTKHYKNVTLDNVEKFLEEILGLSSENEFERKTFEELYQTGNVILLWNGFDVISPTHSELISNIVSEIFENTTNIQIVSTRPLYSQFLREIFSTKPWALVPFDKNAREKFLLKSFEHKNISNDETHAYIEKVSKIISSLNSNPEHSDFSAPLVLEMVAKRVSRDTKISGTENLYEMYQEFIGEKIQIWQNRSEKASLFLNMLATGTRKYGMMEIYQYFALKSEFYKLSNYWSDTRLNMKKLKEMNQKIPTDLAREEISRMGILNINDEYSFQFAHKTFAAFFVAQYVVENLYDGESLDIKETYIRLQILLDVCKSNFVISGETRQPILSFIDSYINGDQVAKKFDSELLKVLRKEYKNFFFDLLSVSDVNLYEFLLNFFKKDHDLLLDLLKVNEAETLYTGAHNCMYLDNSPFGAKLDKKELKALVKNYLSDDEFKSFTDTKNRKGVILFSIYVFSGARDNEIETDEFDTYGARISKEPIRFIASLLEKNELKEFLLSKTSSLYCYNGGFYDKDFILETAQTTLNPQELKTFHINLLENFWNYDDIESADYLLNETLRVVNASEIISLIKSRNLLHKAATNNKPAFEVLWNFTVSQTNREYQKQILLRKENDICYEGRRQNYEDFTFCFLDHSTLNILQKSRVSYNIDIYVKEIYEDYFNASELQNLILDSSDFLPYVVQNSFTEGLEYFVGFLRNVFKGNEDLLKEFLVRDIGSTNQNIFEYLNDFPDLEKHTEILSDLFNTESNQDTDYLDEKVLDALD